MRGPSIPKLRAGELEDAFAAGWEQRRVEFKGAVAFDKVALKLVKAIMAMANLNGGGMVVCGADEGPNKTVVPTGLDGAALATYVPDRIMEKVHNHAAPKVGLEMEVVRDAKGRDFFVIHVLEFDDVPIICKRSGGEGGANGATRLEEGDIYYRNNRKIESARVHTDQDMREILDRATELRLRKLVAVLQRAGVPLQGKDPDARSDDEKYAEERGVLP